MRKFTPWRESLSSLICPKVFQTPSEKVSGFKMKGFAPFFMQFHEQEPSETDC